MNTEKKVTAGICDNCSIAVFLDSGALFCPALQKEINPTAERIAVTSCTGFEPLPAMQVFSEVVTK